MSYIIPEDVSNEYLIEHYGFKKAIWHDTYNLEYRDKDGLGLRIWWKDRSVDILLGQHADYGSAPIPPLLLELYADGNLIKKKGK